ncbi:hypothetical protein, variant 3 [Phytophthora nicotianae CJ01A1]|uniref:Uncharacterized protein n=4 Tax=Phytophthora nicotianae TaxID=4792 RepID=V9F7G9_PHYNI|nr:hypothetical protein, variant 2 [Phytophthora nicotianae P1569]ETK86261.1 hypothetical protein, variant 2 [Phytophthora nicotianae]ETO74975.1 hypothetical protein, variant 2 [Phytophthora nicotianae P1976]ETP16134.1 hypothetical protein, variant 2 [Phytophthora nicotianae CJ01A1]ETI46328.1 hypothetical protein, variant 3 [Phytophthora nicotianae P1569]
MSSDEEIEAELRRGLLNDDNDDRPKNASSMGAVERLVLSPWEKWAAHGRFPYKLMLHIALVLLTFAQMQLYDAQNAAYMRASHRNWAFFFLPPAADIGVVPRFQRDFYTINRTMTAVHFLRDAYFSIGNDSVANYEYLRTSSGEVQPLKLIVDRVLPHGDLETREYLVSQDDESVGPFDPAMSLWQKKHLFRSLRALKFSFPLRDHQFGNFYEECFEWQVNVKFEVIESAQIHVELEDCEVSRCASTHPRPFWTTARQSFVWMHVVVAVVSILYMMLSLKALRRSFQVMARARGLLRDNAKDRENLDNGLHNVTTNAKDGDNSHRYIRQHVPLRSWTEIPFTLKLKLMNELYVNWPRFCSSVANNNVVLQTINRVYLAVTSTCEHHVEFTLLGGSHAYSILASVVACDSVATALELSRGILGAQPAYLFDCLNAQMGNTSRVAVFIGCIPNFLWICPFRDDILRKQNRRVRYAECFDDFSFLAHEWRHYHGHF